MYPRVQIMFICNNHEFDVGMNGSVKFVALVKISQNVTSQFTTTCDL
jgi:hypothetical protein